MTETRKQIIEIIEPYMMKELSFGCYVITETEVCGMETENGTSYDDVFCLGQLTSEDTYFILGYANKYETLLSWEENTYDVNLKYFTDEPEGDDDIDEIYKILGHYDITAVLNYIGQNNFIHEEYGELDIEIEFVPCDDEFSVDWCLGYFNTPNGEGCTEDFHYGIPNKPLHLYTEQEEKDLLELLLKLK